MTSSAIDRIDMVTSAVGTDASRSASSSSRAPGRHGTPCSAELVAHARREAGDDRVGVEVDALRLEHGGCLPEAAAHECERIVVGPSAFERLDELLFGGHPVAFGVDEGAVHVPENGGGQACSHNAQVYGHGLLWRGPREPGAGSGAPSVNQPAGFEGRRLLIVAFEGWNDAGEAATGAAKLLAERLALVEIASVDPELYFDYQFTRPTVVVGDDGVRRIEWPGAAILGPGGRNDLDEPVTGPGASGLHVLIGAEPARSWKGFAAELIDAALTADIDGVVLLGRDARRRPPHATAHGVRLE